MVNLGEEFGVGLAKAEAEKSDPQNPHFVSIRNFELTVMIGVRGNSNRGVSIRKAMKTAKQRVTRKARDTRNLDPFAIRLYADTLFSCSCGVF